MNAVEMCQYLSETFKGVDTVVDSDNTFFFYNPDNAVPPDHKFPFITLVTNDAYDHYSNLSRPEVYRLNIGVSKQTFATLFGTDGEGKQYDYTALDRLMPHPEYGMMYWLCILSPSTAVFDTQVRPLLVEAYEAAVNKYERKTTRS